MTGKSPYVLDFIEKQEFIERANEFCTPVWECIEKEKKNQRKKYYKNLSNEAKSKIRESQKKYAKSVKGIISTIKSRLNRQKMKTDSMVDISDEQWKMISDFYKKCPTGFHVDHVIPISKGGKHRMSNLQYLTARENMEKSDRIDFLECTE